MGSLPALQIPNFKTSASPDQCHLALQAKLFAEIFRQHETALFVRCSVLGARVKLPKKNTPIACRNTGLRLRLSAHPAKLLVRHDQEVLVLRLRQNNQILAFSPSPT